MVTGSTGYVGGVLVKQLLEEGLTVHCPVRDPTKESSLRCLRDLLPGSESSDRLRFFKADLMEEGSYLESMKGCSVVFHVASPFSFTVPPGKEKEVFFDPAVEGTLNVLRSARDPSLESCVKRVVVTSSVYGMAVDGTDTAEVFAKTGKMCDEKTWNTTSSVGYNPYAHSKVMAEKAAWDFWKNGDDDSPGKCSYDLVVCNPSFVMGPGLRVYESSQSYRFLKSMGDGTMKSGCPDTGLPVVDVRDVARGHVKAGFLPSDKVAGERFILSGANTNILGMADAIRKKFPDHPLPPSNLNKFLVWLLAPYMEMTRLQVWRAVGIFFEFDNAKSRKVLEIGEYTPLDDTMQEIFQQCVEGGFIPSIAGSASAAGATEATAPENE